RLSIPSHEQCLVHISPGARCPETAPLEFPCRKNSTSIRGSSTARRQLPADACRRRLPEFFQGGDHSRLVRLGELVIERQPQQTIAYILSHRAIAFFATELPAHAREMQRQVMKDSVYLASAKMCDQGLPLGQRSHHEIKHVVGLLTG